jgi:hypothetical protein
MPTVSLTPTVFSNLTYITMYCTIFFLGIRIVQLSTTDFPLAWLGLFEKVYADHVRM